MNFGERLKGLLDDGEISQRKFAKMLNIAPSTLNGYIKNTRQPDFELVKKIAAELNVSIDYLFDCDSAAAMNADEMRLVQKFRAMDNKNKRLVLELADALSENNK